MLHGESGQVAMLAEWPAVYRLAGHEACHEVLAGSPDRSTLMRLWIGPGFALVMFGCGSPPPPTPVAQSAPSTTLSPSGTKRIVEDGAGGYILPDGTRVAADEKGGFRLPNGDYVAPLADGLLLPNGVRCKADGVGGHVCP
jgi:hypothetical protein